LLQHREHVGRKLEQERSEADYEPSENSHTLFPNLGANSVAVQSLEWDLDRLNLAESTQFWGNVNPRIATSARVSRVRSPVGSKVHGDVTPASSLQSL